jgi:hypothetical protein
MIALRPTASEERWLAAKERFGDAVAGPARTGGWRTSRLFARIAFFFLGALTCGAAWGFFALIGNWRAGAFIAGAASLAVGELLIGGKRFFRSGLEEALHACGVALVGVALLPDNPDQTTVGIVLTAAAAIVAFRLLNPLFLAAAACAGAWTVNELTNSVAAAALCWIGAVVVWLALTKRFARPSSEAMLSWLALVLPVLGWLWSKKFDFDPWHYLWRGGMTASDFASAASPLTLLVAIAVSLTLGLRYRHHALLLASMLCTGMLAFELRALTGASLEQRFAVEGAILLVVSSLIERRLRGRTTGITSDPIAPTSDAAKLMELAVTVTMAAAQQGSTDTKPTMDPGGGQFGGAGASGGF